MAIETIGKYQMHLIAREVSAGAKWAPYLQIDKFNDEMQNFECVVERHRVAGHDVFDSEEAAEDIARQFGNALIAARNA